MKAVVYVKDGCAYSGMAVKLLEENGVKVITKSISGSKKVQKELYDITGQIGVPVIVFEDDNEPIIGYDKTRLCSILGIEEEED